MNKKTKNIIIVASIILIIVALIIILITNLGKDEKVSEIGTTTTTTQKKEGLELKDEVNDISIIFENSQLAEGNKLKIETVSNVNIEDVVAVYDINLVDIDNKVVKVENSSLKISIPYNNVENYNEFKVLYLSDNNEVLETIDAYYTNGKVVFTVSHLSKYAIKAKKVEETTTTTTTSTKQTTTNSTTQKSPETTTNSTTEKTTQKTTVKTTQPTTQKTTQKTTQTTTTTTKPAKTYSIQWGSEKDGAGQQYLYIVDNSGNRVSGTITVTYNGTSYSETKSVPISGILLIKDIVTISNVKGN